MKENIPNRNSTLENFIPFLKVDVIVSDIDGTLVSGDGKTIGQVRDMINALGRQKIFFSIATGRTYAGVKGLLQNLNLKKGIPIGLYNGGIVLEYGTTNVLSANVLNNEECMQLLEILYSLKVNVYIYTFNINQDPIVLDNQDRIEEKVYGIGDRYRKFDVNGIEILWLDDFEKIEGNINAILIEKKGVSDDVVKKIMLIISGMSNVIYTDSGSGFLELKKQGVDKAAVIDYLRIFAEKQRNEKKETIKILAIGDNDNDLEMFQSADLGVAVANASLLAMEVADYICERESAEGVLDMLNAIRIARKYYGDK